MVVIDDIHIPRRQNQPVRSLPPDDFPRRSATKSTRSNESTPDLGATLAPATPLKPPEPQYKPGTN